MRPIKTSTAKLGAALFSAILLAVIFLLNAADAPDRESQYVHDRGYVYLNTAKDVKYVGAEACKECHAKTYEAYMKTPTGRSMSRMDTSNVREVFPQSEAVYDSVKQYYYEMARRGDKFYQREYRLGPDGEVMHERLMQAQYIMGSGENLRTYYYDEHGMFYQLPLTWYENKVAWDLSMGYREFGNIRFSRFASDRCFFCHNSYLKVNPAANDRYLKPYPLGIGCESCHGPGELHVKQEHGEKIDLPFENARTIVNPGKLSLQRRTDVCRSCHLQGKTRALRGDNHWFDFRPGMLLESHHSEYFPDEVHVEAFKVANTAFRLEQSKCYTQSHGLTDCIVCHDPHGLSTVDRTEYNNQRCMQCHPPENLSRDGARYAHAATDNCVPCHMNQTDSDNTLHGVVESDHWIRINANMTEIDWSVFRTFPQTKPLVELVPYLDAKDGKEAKRLGIAYYNYYHESDNRTAYLDSALKYLSIDSGPADEDARRELYLGKTLLDLGRPEEAIPALNRAIELKPEDGEAYFRRGEAYNTAKRYVEAIASYRRATELMPDEPKYYEGLGLALAADDQPAEAISVLERSLQIDKQSPYPYYTLGNLYAIKLKEPARAVEYFKQLVVLEPDFPNGYLNLGNTYTMLGKYEKAIKNYRKELFLRPGSRNAYINLARVYQMTGKQAEAQKALRKAVEMGTPGKRNKSSKE